MDFFKELQVTIENVVNSMKLTDYCIGTVLQVTPLKIDLGDRKKIEDVGTNFYYTEQVLTKKINSDNSIIYIKNITIGDKLILLRVAKGQKFIILSKSYEPDKKYLGG